MVLNEITLFKQRTAKAFAGLNKPTRILIALIFAALAAYSFLWMTDKLFIYILSRSYVSEIAEVFDLNRHLTQAISIFVFIVFACLFSLIFSFYRSRRIIGFLGFAAMLITQSLLLWYGTREQVVTREGKAIKCFTLSRDGSVNYRERAGIDPVTGLQCQDVTPEILERLREYEKGKRPERVAENEDDEEPIFFDPRSGKAVIWYWRAKSGDIELFNLMGFHPESGDALLPISSDVVAEWKQQRRWKERHRHPPNRIDPQTYDFFDPKTGEVRGWYWRSTDNDYEFYDNPGFQPSTGEPLLPVTKEVVEDSKRRAEKRCYIITREAVLYSSKPGIDPATGRQCREITRGILERLREYEKGNRPRLVTSKEPIFFDVRSGDPAVWYSKDSTGKIAFYDLMGFDPNTGEELLPITQKIIGEWRDQIDKQKEEQRRQEEEERRKQRPPQLIVAESIPFFNPATGKPQVWYWRSPDGEYEFYDNEGFHPRTGEPLMPITKGVARAWKHELAAAERRRRQEQQRQEQDEIAQKKRDQEEMQSGTFCDQAAANPADPRKPADVPGIPYLELKERAREAASICQIAVEKYPEELRYKYQYARALDFSETDKAMAIFRALTREKYPAAFDNLGSALLRQNKMAEAVGVFKRGVELGDPDSMVSLADLVQRGALAVADPAGARFALLSRAAKLGHQGALRILQEENLRYQQNQQEQLSRQQQEQMMLNMFNTILRGVVH